MDKKLVNIVDIRVSQTAFYGFIFISKPSSIIRVSVK